MTATDRRVGRWRVRRPVGGLLARAPLALAVAATLAVAPAAIAAPEPAVDLTVSVSSASDDGGPIRAGRYFTYTLTVRNLGTAAAGGVVVRHVLPVIPAGTEIFLPIEQGGFTCRVAEEPGPTAAVTCAGGTVPAGGGAALRFQAAFSEGDPESAVLRAFGDADPDEPLLIATAATVDPDDAIAESDEGNNTAREQTALGPPPAPGDAPPSD